MSSYNLEIPQTSLDWCFLKHRRPGEFTKLNQAKKSKTKQKDKKHRKLGKQPLLCDAAPGFTLCTSAVTSSRSDGITQKAGYAPSERTRMLTREGVPHHWFRTLRNRSRHSGLEGGGNKCEQTSPANTESDKNDEHDQGNQSWPRGCGGRVRGCTRTCNKPCLVNGVEVANSCCTCSGWGTRNHSSRICLRPRYQVLSASLPSSS